MYLNVTGAANTAVGWQSLYNNTAATSTVAVGYYAGYGGVGAYNSQGSVFIGNEAGQGVLSKSDYNTFIGFRAGYNVGAGANNIIIGQRADLSNQSAQAQLNIGNVIFGTGMYSGSSVSSAAVSTSTIAIG